MFMEDIWVEVLIAMEEDPVRHLRNKLNKTFDEFIYSFIHPFMHGFMQPFKHGFIHPFMLSFFQSFREISTPLKILREILHGSHEDKQIAVETPHSHFAVGEELLETSDRNILVTLQLKIR